MVTMSAANTTALKTFDAAQFISGFRAVTATVPLFQKADLLPQIDEMDARLDQMEAQLVEEQKNKNRSMSDKSVVRELNSLTEERNALVEEFEESKVLFKFRPFTAPELKTWQHRTKELTEAEESDLPIFAEGIALTCISHPMTVDEWMSLCDSVGAYAFLAFGKAWQLAIASNGAPDAPFSRRSSPTLNKESSSAV